MRPLDGIEFALRLRAQASSPQEIADLIGDLVNEPGVGPARVLHEARSNPAIFQIDEAGRIGLIQPRIADRAAFFRNALADLQSALRLIPFGPDASALELALIYALAMRRRDMAPSLVKRGQGLWPIVDELTKEFPELERIISLSLESGGMLVLGQVTSSLLRMAAAGLERMEYVEAMRELLLRDQRTAQFSIPPSIGRLMCSLLGNEVRDVFDPYADPGLLPFLFSGTQGRTVSATGLFYSSLGRMATVLQARLLGANLDALKANANIDLARLPGPFEHCICMPPFAGKAKERLGRNRDQQPMSATEIHELVINLAIKRLAPTGRAVILVPESMLFNAARAYTRKYIMDLGILKAVISLPIGVFPHTGVKTSILVLQKGMPANTPVRFMDAAPFSTSVLKQGRILDTEAIMRVFNSEHATPEVVDVPLAEIRSDEQSSWAASRFSSRAKYAIAGDGSPETAVVELGSVLQDDILAMGSPVGLPLFQVTELSGEVLDLTRTAASGQQVWEDDRKAARRLDVPALLVARVGGRLKPTLFDPRDGAIAVGGNVYMFRVDTERADPEYLCLELRSELVQEQLDAYHQGQTIASIAKSDLLRLVVRLPESLSEQRQVVRQRKEAILTAKREELARQEAKHGLSATEWQLIGAVEHSLRPVIAQVEAPMGDIRKCLAALNMEQRTTIEGALGEINQALDRMRGMFKVINQVLLVDKAGMQKAPWDLRRLFRNEVRALGPLIDGLQVYMRCDPALESADGIIAHVDRDQFALIIQNLLTNTAKHAGASIGDPTHVLVTVTPRADGPRNWIVLTIENDGAPFPPGFNHEDFITPGKRVDAKKGTGLGGYLIDRIIANHGGTFHSRNLPAGDESLREGHRFEHRLDAPATPQDRPFTATHVRVQFTIELPANSYTDA